MIDKWYLTNRIDGQIEFYRKGQEKNENAYERLQLELPTGRGVAAVSAVAAVSTPDSPLGRRADDGRRGGQRQAWRSARSTSPRVRR